MVEYVYGILEGTDSLEELGDQKIVVHRYGWENLKVLEIMVVGRAIGPMRDKLGSKVSDVERIVSSKERADLGKILDDLFGRDLPQYGERRVQFLD